MTFGKLCLIAVLLILAYLIGAFGFDGAYTLFNTDSSILAAAGMALFFVVIYALGMILFGIYRIIIPKKPKQGTTTNEDE